jgi:demethylmenaquinone methyltransferase/2-methoxy-6-polyprenyl-1,4-benzoquinol methylase
MSADHKTSFGFKKVSPQEKTEEVYSVFKRVASRYDLMNDVMSLGIHRLWKQKLIEMIRPRPGMHLLDVAGGTGDIVIRFLKAAKFYTPQAQATVCDRNEAMMVEGRNKAIDAGITQSLDWVCADAAGLPFASNSFDTYSISFGLRNVTDIPSSLKEAWRVLKPGGQYFCLEFSKVENPWFQKAYEEYSFRLIPKLGAWIAQDRDAYQYLVESIARFPDQAMLMKMIQTAGFEQASYVNMSNGIVAIHSGIKV